jgi:hypothetical protein
MFSLLFGLCSIFFAWRRSNDRLTSVLATTIFSAVYWVAQAGAILYPGTAAFDPDTVTPRSTFIGVPVQIYVQLFCFILTGLAAWLALKPNAKWTR